MWIKTLSTKPEKDWGSFVWVSDEPKQILLSWQSHSSWTRHHITIYRRAWSRSLLRCRTQPGITHRTHLLLPSAASACIVRNQLGQEITARLVSAFVLSRLDYCNALLPASTLAPLQRVMNAAARLVCNLSPRDHITSALHSLHWLPIKQRIGYKLCLLIHLSINKRAPVSLITTTSSIPGRSSNSSVSNNDVVVPRTKLKLGLSLGTNCLPISKSKQILCHLSVNWKLSYSKSLIQTKCWLYERACYFNFVMGHCSLVSGNKDNVHDYLLLLRCRTTI